MSKWVDYGAGCLQLKDFMPAFLFPNIMEDLKVLGGGRKTPIFDMQETFPSFAITMVINEIFF